MPEFKYELKKQVKVLSESKGYTVEANIIAYGENGNNKLDIRKWNRNTDRMSKGITLNKEEAKALLDALKDFNFDEID